MLTIYVDGSCAMHSTRCAGWAVISSDGVEFGGYLPNSTNNRAEMTAVYEALNYCKYTAQTATVYSDSEYTVKGLNQWAKKWCKDDWRKEIKNKDIWQRLYPLFLELDCKVVWCKGHSGIEGNEKADTLAKYCEKNKKSVDNRK